MKCFLVLYLTSIVIIVTVRAATTVDQAKDPKQVRLIRFRKVAVEVNTTVEEKTEQDEQLDDNKKGTRKGDDNKKQSKKVEPRIFGGEEAPQGSFPFFAHPEGGGCGATLIWPDILLTAGHCKGFFKKKRAIIGGNEFNGGDGTFIEVAKEHRHKEYNKKTLKNDIMLVKLKDPSSAPLVTLNSDPSTPAVGEVVRAIGYGDDENGQTPAKLKQAFLDIFDDNDCESTYNNIYFPDTNICAGTADGTRDVCPGDSGGPLLTTSNVQVGIVSFGYTESICGNSPPDGFTDVAAYSQWILNGICKYSDVPPANCPNQPKGAKGGRRLKPERTRKWRARN